MKRSKPVGATLSGETLRWFEWLRKYDPEFSTDEGTIKYLLALGVEKHKELSAKQYNERQEDDNI